MSQAPRIFTRRHVLEVMGGVIGSLALHACTQSSETASSPAASGSPGDSTAPVKSTNGSTLWIGYSPLYIAAEKGFFKEGGLDLEVKVFSSTGEADSAIAAGRIDSINNVTSEAVSLMSKFQDFRIVQIADSSLGGDGILARNDVKSIADFKGREIAVELNSVSHFFLLQVLQEAGLSGNDVKLTNVTPDAAAAAYSSGKADIAVTYAPFLQQANQGQKDGRVIYDTSKMPTAIMDLYVFRSQFVQEHPQAVQGFVNGIFKAQEFLKTNTQEALAIAGKQLGLKPDEVAEQLKGVNLTNLDDNLKILAEPTSKVYLVNHMENLGKFLKGQNQISTAPTPEQIKALIDPSFVKQAKAGA
jgi:NitT/TauT family transport system substrate-binding protein